MQLNERISAYLERRKEVGTYRELKKKNHLIDFCSNDYLGFSCNNDLQKSIHTSIGDDKNIGATGSRLISGNSEAVEGLELQLANFFKAEKALIFNSGYTANLAVIATLARKGDIIIYDELIHASLHDGLKLSKAENYSFKHNCYTHLEEQLELYNCDLKRGNCLFIVIESLYSMDGDYCDIKTIVEVAEKYNAHIILDEAHSTGICGKGRGWAVENQVEDKVFARIHTFGKGFGYHGASVFGENNLIDYLINFARPFIYTTALPNHSIKTLEQILYFADNELFINNLNDNISYFKTKTKPIESYFLKSDSPIQSLIYKGNDKVKYLAQLLEMECGIYVKAIVSPTVPEGRERLRICLHALNTKQEIDLLTYTLCQCLTSFPL